MTPNLEALRDLLVKAGDRRNQGVIYELENE
jgi:hypothetical protein